MLQARRVQRGACEGSRCLVTDAARRLPVPSLVSRPVGRSAGIHSGALGLPTEASMIAFQEYRQRWSTPGVLIEPPVKPVLSKNSSALLIVLET